MGQSNGARPWGAGAFFKEECGVCGIAGQIGRPGWRADRMTEVYRGMQKVLARRGPDQEGMYLEENAALVHARLCVVDPERGRQPMTLRRGEEAYAMVYNGELYNTGELRAELEALGHRFETHSDTEVLLHAYAQWKEGCMERLNGIFAFAVWEKDRGRLFLARDRMGVKPLFYARRRGSLLFASELKALLCHPWVEPEVDREGLAQVLLLGPGRVPGSGVFREVFELRPGECGWYDAGEDRLTLRRYWRLTDRPFTDTFEEAVEKTRQLVLDAIQRQLSADVPVCTFLSGGLDSSLISAVADRFFTRRGMTLHTVSVDYKDNERYFQASKFQPNSDPAFIRRMNEALHAQNHLVLLDTPELAQALDWAVEARDLPGMADVDSSLLLFCREIKRIATVALSGECADEIFGGYPWYRDPTVREREGFPWAQSTAWRAGFLRPGVLGSLDPAEYVDYYYRRTVADSHILPDAPPLERRMKEMMNLNVDWFMQTLLDRKDRMSMYSGLEVRVPFCDHRIAEYLYTVPWAFKDHNGVEKGLLREAMAGVLPEEVLWRKKSPYPKTHHPAYLQAVSARLREVISDPAAPLLELVRPQALEELLESQRSTPWYGQLMTTPQTIAYFLQLDHWLRHYHVRLVD